MAYPYRGPSNLSLFHVQSVNGKSTRQPLCSINIPKGAYKGVLILQEGKGGSYKISAHWYSDKELLGGARIINLTGRMLDLQISGKDKPIVLQPDAQTTLKAKFDKENGGFAYLLVNAYVREKRADGSEKKYKVMSKNLALKQNDAQLVLLQLRQKRMIQTISLSAGGVSNREALIELQKHLPTSKGR